jgi:sulfonate transport system ATP-binding protein
VGEAVTLADRIVLVEAGSIAGDFPADLPRPRPRGSTKFAGIEAAILQLLLA